MFALYLPGGAYSWLLIAHHSSVSLLGSLTLALGPVAMYVLLCLINFSTPEEADETDVGANFEEKYPRTQTQEQIAAFINLLVSFGLGLLLLIFVSAITLLYYPRRDMMLAEDTEQKGPSRGFWLLSVGLMMRRYHMRLKEEHLCENDMEEEGLKCWNIPKPGVSNDDKDGKPFRKVTDYCPICLEHYDVGDKIAWSSNPSCHHHYHEQCILAWMLPSTSANQECPCCRQTFLSLQDCPDVAKRVN